MLPFASLNAATTAGPGTARDLEDAVRPHSMVVVFSGITGGQQNQVALEGSHDGTTWIQIGLVTRTSDGVALATSEILVRHIRANFTLLNGTPTVTATIASDTGEGS